VIRLDRIGARSHRLVEHDLRANASRWSRGKPVSLFRIMLSLNARSRPGYVKAAASVAAAFLRLVRSAAECRTGSMTADSTGQIPPKANARPVVPKRCLNDRKAA